MRLWLAITIVALILLGMLAFLAAREPDATLGYADPGVVPMRAG